MPDLKDKVALITGASSGIGAATAEHFASLGSQLSLTGRNLEQLESIRNKCIAAGLKENQVYITTCDVRNRGDLANLVDETLKRFGKIDILINAAGILKIGRLTRTSIDAYDELMGINVRAVVELCQLASPHLIKTKGAIVNVSSVAASCSFPDVTYYCISKAAIDQLTKCLALELAPQGVRVNSVNPGVVATEIHKRAGMSEESYAKYLDYSKTTHPLGRIGEPVEMAKAIAFLASDDASFITGDLLSVDGGRRIVDFK